MTAQAAETLIYAGKEISMFSNPLNLYLQQMGIAFQSPNTACWRGYYGTWEIKGSEETQERLYLVGLEAHESYEKILSLKDIFPDHPNGVFAHWYSGEVRLPQGSLLKYIHGGYASVYEYDLFIQFEKGVVVNKRAVHNKVPDGEL